MVVTLECCLPRDNFLFVRGGRVCGLAVSHLSMSAAQDVEGRATVLFRAIIVFMLAAAGGGIRPYFALEDDSTLISDGISIR